MDGPGPIYNTVLGKYANQALVTQQVGPAMAGALFNFMLFGVAMGELSTYVESSRYRTDSWRLKAVVASVLLCSSIQTSFHSYLVYAYGTTQARDAMSLLFIPSTLECFDSTFVGIAGAIVQTYLSIRAATLFESRKWKIVYFTISGIVIAVGLFGALSYLALALMLKDGKVEQALPLTLQIVSSLWLWGCATSDVIVTVVLVVGLRRRMKGFRAATDTLLKDLIFLAIQSASYTAVFAVIPAYIAVGVKQDAPTARAGFAFAIPLTSCYLMSLLHNLNSSGKLREKKDNDRTGNYISGTNINVHRSTVGGISAFNPGRSGRVPMKLDIAFEMQSQTFTEDERGRKVETMIDM